MFKSGGEFTTGRPRGGREGGGIRVWERESVNEGEGGEMRAMLRPAGSV